MLYTILHNDTSKESQTDKLSIKRNSARRSSYNVNQAEKNRQTHITHIQYCNLRISQKIDHVTFYSRFLFIRLHIQYGLCILVAIYGLIVVPCN